MNAHPRQLAGRVARHLWTQWVRPLALPFLLIASAKSALADINYVPSGSMKPTILEGDVVFINKLAYDLRVPFTTLRVARWAAPERGDIVVCFAPDDGTRLVKRVVALPGDTVELRNDVLFINGTARTYSALAPEATRHFTVTERRAAAFARESDDRRDGPGSHAVMALPAAPALRTFGPVQVPADSYFVMGDNRDNSRDSRFFGVVPRREIIGEAKGVFLSADLQRYLAPRFDRFFSGLE
ncbi:MAG: signal peptidase I [Verrucomicrobiota bacterium]